MRSATCFAATIPSVQRRVKVHESNRKRILAASQRTFTPRLERLEVRLALATVFLVTNTDDSGAGSFRQAIVDANAATDPPTIEFHIPVTDANFVDADSALPGGDAAPDVFVIEPLSALPALTRDAIFVAGPSQTAFTGDTNPFGPEIVLDGASAGAASGLWLDSDGNQLRGLNICGFGDSGILLTGHSNIVAGNFIGTTADGLDARGNVLYGVYLANGASDNTIGGSNAGAGNVISASGSTGVYLEGATTTGNAVLGNLIGTDKNGTAKLPNFDGIAISNASGNRIGGPAAGERNVISGNTRFGVHLSSLSGNVVQGNYVGTDVTGAETHGVENGHGVFLNGDLDSLIGGTQPGEGNAIAGSGWGIWLGGVTSNRHTSGTRIHGNRIGTSADGSQARGNSWGIYVEGQDGHEVHDVLIGGSTPGAGNLISGNYLEGIIMRGGGAQRIHIQGNSIHANGGLGIDLNGDGVTQNDSGDGDSGPNNLRNFPVLTSAAAGGSTRVTGTLNSTPGSVSTLDFYASAAADPSGFGEGQRWLGSIIVSTDLTGNAAFDANLIAATAIGEFITATATDTNGNTSEFCGSKEISVLAVQIDVKPGSITNPLNLQENGVIPVAILTTPGFDARRVDTSTVIFAGAHAIQSALEDIDHDGDLDMILHFRVRETNLMAAYVELLAADLADHRLDSSHQKYSAALTGQTVDDVLFAGADELDLFLAGKNLRELLDRFASIPRT